jgi:hypothetical protein
MIVNQAKLPLWAQRLHHNRQDPALRTTSWPASPEEGLLQSLALSDLGHRQWLASLRHENPDKSAQEVEQLAYDSATRWQGVRNRLTFNRSF